MATRGDCAVKAYRGDQVAGAEPHGDTSQIVAATAESDARWRPRSVTIAHDYLNQRGGAERVVVQLAAIWAETSIVTSLYRPSSSHDEFRQLDVQKSFLDRLPLDRGFRLLAPFYPLAFRSLGTLSEDLVISSSTGWAHGVRTTPDSLHLVYCHAPARWLYATKEYLPRRRSRVASAPLLAALRRWDQGAARRADRYIATNENVRRRVRDVYGIEADVVHPPVDIERFTPRPRGERLLVVSRLLPYKRIDLAIAAATKLGLGLDVVGDGPLLGQLRAIAGPSVRFHGRVDDRAVTELLEGCRGVCVPAAEDFGIVPIEAMAAGKPVVAFAAGGALESLEAGVTAVFFDQPTVESLIAAIRKLDEIETEPAMLARSAQRFSVEAFQRNMLAAVQRAHELRLSTAGDG
jgi:glycosyltransferase involved in cell wall biosynthesis